MDALARLLRPASVAIIGASADPEKLTGRPVAYLQKHGFAGKIYPVNPRYPSIAGLPCYRDVTSLPAPPDVGLVLLGAELATDAVRQLAAAGAAAAIVLASGVPMRASRFCTGCPSRRSRRSTARRPGSAATSRCAAISSSPRRAPASP